MAATEEYRHDEDLIASFIERRARPAEGLTVSARFLYTAYKNWCETQRLKPMSGTSFGKKMAARFEKGAEKQRRSV